MLESIEVTGGGQSRVSIAGGRKSVNILEDQCGGLNQNSSHGFIHLNTWSPVDGTICEELGGVAFLEDVYHWWWVFKVQKLMPYSVSYFSPDHGCA